MASPGAMRFKWGERVPGMNSYEWMQYEGVRYSLHDCVHVGLDLVVPHVAKIMRLFEAHGKHMVRVRWFMRDCELPPAVCKGLAKIDKKELFIAQGNAKGVEQEIPVEDIFEKVTVLCTAEVQGGNLQPSQQLVDDALYYFNRVYDGKERKLFKIDKIYKSLGSLAQKLYNKREWVSDQNARSLDVHDDAPPGSSKRPTSTLSAHTARKKLRHE